MKKIIKSFILLSTFTVCGLFMASCSETEEEGRYDNWRNRNENFIDSLSNVMDSGSDPELYAVIDEYDKAQRIFYKKLTTKDEGDIPLFNDSIVCYYYGAYINGDRFDGNFDGKEIQPNDKPTGFKLNSLVSGWIWPLQQMKVGERWMLYIPWQSGYGEKTSSGGIPGYSTLIFTIQLEEVVVK
ncbi:MAG: FKBP-type peptidyl-prolyl cis-trans isomerase [Bacteroides sp.]|nr:FKBP-type peptidyl-prolyl cis-trans isomerase [Bacteroides sp.]MDD2644873.1 FKBP-type peptidyl-prolyl cis-trans isomerase [Bacteroides sp.]MDD4055182.1 FKBP-type peptidyl-prolyl cis-trans isomerase [Bacteroides sp.]MDD4720880.1 FKBP-type peptidyl-prolyl cis-trans isomerase [Bacteroides sp.]NLI63562.1 peptidylprolyl isomerase [Bacteroidales bacterium]